VGDRGPAAVARLAGEGGDGGRPAVLAGERDPAGIGAQLGGVVGAPLERLARPVRGGGEHHGGDAGRQLGAQAAVARDDHEQRRPRGRRRRPAHLGADAAAEVEVGVRGHAGILDPRP
jgi:hypothetical protein